VKVEIRENRERSEKVWQRSAALGVGLSEPVFNLKEASYKRPAIPSFSPF
jgi:hypothetical protein